MMRPITTFLTVVILVTIGIIWLTLTWKPPGVGLRVSPNKNEELLSLTGTTARLAGDNYLRTAVAYAQAVYPAAQDQDRPGAVILVRDDDQLTAIATTRLQHFPVNAPILYVTDNGTTLPEATRDEIRRLHPEGVMMDNNIQVYLVGDISPAIAQEIQAMGFNVRRIFAQNGVELAEQLDEYLAVLDATHSYEVLVGASNRPDFALPAANWNSHMGKGFAWISPDGVPTATQRLLERRSPVQPYIYVFAPRNVIGDEVMADLSRYGHVQRIPGETPQEMAVRWAGYKDFGRELGWWFGESERSVGWGVAEPGHNIILANPADWREVVPSGVLSHMGKHAFLVLTTLNGDLTDPVVSYLRIIKPTRTHPSDQVLNFGWIIGSGIGDDTVRNVSELLGVAEPLGE